MTAASVLGLYDPSKPVTVSVDASQRGLGAVMLQNEQPVEFTSSALTETQQSWLVWNDLTEYEGIVFKGQQVIVPVALRKAAISNIHDGHFDIVRCTERAKTAVYWPGYINQIRDTAVQSRPGADTSVYLYLLYLDTLFSKYLYLDTLFSKYLYLDTVAMYLNFQILFR